MKLYKCYVLLDGVADEYLVSATTNKNAVIELKRRIKEETSTTKLVIEEIKEVE